MGWQLGYRPALDGLRGFAVALVLVTHVYVPGGGELGAVGVTIFFTLSGFLITTLLLEERGRFGRFSLTDFYRRRMARLAPALFLAVALAVVVEVIVVGRVADWTLVAGALTWTSNVTMMDGQSPITPLTHTWSLAVEEQFYVLWPLVLLVLVRFRRTFVVMALAYLALASVVTRIQVFDPTVYLGHSYLGLDTRADQLLIGAILAVASVGSRDRRVSAWWAVPPVALILVVGLLPYRSLLTPTIVALSAAAVLFVATRTSVPWLEGRRLMWVGVHAYGIYLYHRPIGMAVDAAVPGDSWWVAAPFTVGVTLVVAWASLRWVENPIRKRFRSGRTGDGSGELVERDPVGGAAPGRVAGTDVGEREVVRQGAGDRESGR